MSVPLATFSLYDGSEYSVLERPQRRDDPLVMRFVLKHETGTPPPHVHPATTEVFEVLEGEFEMLVGEEWRTVTAGESVTVPPGLRHSFRNESGADVVIRNVHEPHHDFEAYIRSIAALSQELETVKPSGPGAMMRMAVLWGRHKDLIEPADAPMKVGMAVLRTAGRVVGVSAPE
jgi:mannose-6-phosphate isomerase-like protein (cupin superfamily)